MPVLLADHGGQEFKGDAGHADQRNASQRPPGNANQSANEKRDDCEGGNVSGFQVWFHGPKIRWDRKNVNPTLPNQKVGLHNRRIITSRARLRVLQLDWTRIGPQTLEIVKITGFRGHQMHDDVPEIDQHPTRAWAFNGGWTNADVTHFVQYAALERLQLRLRVGAGNHEVIQAGRDARQVQDRDVGGFFIVERIVNHFQVLEDFRCVFDWNIFLNIGNDGNLRAPNQYDPRVETTAYRTEPSGSSP